MEKIVILADDRSFEEVVAALDGHPVDRAASGEEALRMLLTGCYHVLVTNLVLPDMDWLDLLSRTRKLDPSIDVILLTDHAHVRTALEALKQGASDYMVTPVNHDRLRHILARCFRMRRLADEAEELKRQVTLYQAAEAMAHRLDLDELANTVIAAFSSELGVMRGLGIFVDEEGYFSLKGITGMDEVSGRALAEVVMTAFEKRADRADPLVTLTNFIPREPQFAFAAKADLRDAVVVGVQSKNVLQGIVALFNDKKQPLPVNFNSRNLRFLADHSSRALENAVRYTTARNLVNIDELTGLFNYRYLETALDREVKRAERYRSSLSVVFLDLDQFKLINDTHGHLVGSKILKEVGDLLKRLVREVDTVIRYGGDEYTIILVESTNVGAARVAERIREAVERHAFLAAEGLHIRLTASLGYACYPDDSKSHVELLQLADQAMYRGKFSGKNVVFHIGQSKEEGE